METRKCDNCGIHYIVTKIEKDEAESLLFINNRIDTANRFLRESQNQKVIQASLALISDSQLIAKKWWDAIAEKYRINLNEKNYMIDYSNLEIYFRS